MFVASSDFFPLSGMLKHGQLGKAEETYGKQTGLGERQQRKTEEGQKDK